MKPNSFLNSLNRTNYNGTTENQLTINEKMYGVECYTSSFLVEFDNYLNTIAPKTIRFQVQADISCKGAKALIDVASKGQFKLLEEQINNYPVKKEFDEYAFAYRVHLLIAAIQSGSFNTILQVVLLNERENYASEIIFGDARNLFQFYIDDYEAKYLDKKFKENSLKICKLLEISNFIKTLESLMMQSFKLHELYDFSKVKEFLVQQLEKHNENNVAINVNPKKEWYQFWKQSNDQKYQNDSKIISALINEFNQESCNTVANIFQAITGLRDKYPEKSPELANTLNFFVGICTAMRRLDIEIQKSLQQEAKKIPSNKN